MSSGYECCPVCSGYKVLSDTYAPIGYYKKHCESCLLMWIEHISGGIIGCTQMVSLEEAKKGLGVGKFKSLGGF